jgi:hypothetical protein
MQEFVHLLPYLIHVFPNQVSSSRMKKQMNGWGEGEDATLRSMPSPISLHQWRQDDWQSPPFVQHTSGRRPTTRPPHPAATSNTEAHV